MEVSGRVNIALAEEEDTEELAHICKRAFDTEVDVGAPGLGGPIGYDSPGAQVCLIRFMDYYKVLLDGEPVGDVVVGYAEEEHRVLERIFVDPDHHKTGRGTRAMELVYRLYPGVKLWTFGTLSGT